MALQFGKLGTAVVFNFSIMGETQVAGALTGILQRIGNLRPIWPKIEKVIRGSADQMFETEGGDRYKWPSLSPLTVMQREMLGFPGEHPILVRSGRLKDSIVQATHPDHIFRTGEKWMETGTTVEYAAIHQSPAARTKIPRRPFYYIDAKDVSRMVQAIRTFINPSLSKSGVSSGL